MDVKVTSTDKMSEVFDEKDEKYREWATKETREKKVEKAVMVPIIISHDGAVHSDSVGRKKDFAPDIKDDWLRIAQNVLRHFVVTVGCSSIMAAGSPRRGGESVQNNSVMNQMALPRE